MAGGYLTSVVQHLRRATLPHDGERTRADGELLGAFVAEQDALAFESLVRRHGPMVLGICRRILRHESDAEDAFQATFVVLVRKAASIMPRETVSKWLYGVAYRTSLGARRARSRRQAKEKQVVETPHPQIEFAEPWDDLRPLLDHELNRLPDKFRWPLILCDLEGRTRTSVARQLKLPGGTLSNRLASARRILAKRLTQRGLTLSAAGLATVLSENALSAQISASLIDCTVKAAMVTAAGQAAGVISAPVAALAEGVLKAMFLTKLKNAVVAVLILSAVAVGAGGAALTARAAKQVDDKKDDMPQPEKKRIDEPKAAALFTERSHDFGNVAGERQVSWRCRDEKPNQRDIPNLRSSCR